MGDDYNPQAIESKWQAKWAEDELYRSVIEPDHTKFYAMTMLPYPSGNLHIGHWYAMAPSDARARFLRMRGYNVMFPMGFDAFGLPAENAAIQRGIHPKTWTYANIEKMREQLKSMGTMIDWEREAISADPEYYRWTQWFFEQFFKNGLAYKKESPVDFCPHCNTTLAREQVWGEDRVCERCGTPVIKKNLNQWFFKITDYAEELLDFSGIEWPERVVTMQKNWIGRSEGAQVVFKTEHGDEMPVFTTRPDTLWGATFMVMAPEHPLVESLVTDEQREAVAAYVDQAARASDIEREAADREKTGVFTGGYAINPVNGERIPIWVADYVLMTYGSGAIMAVPAHDQRDFDFARTFGLEIRGVIQPPPEALPEYLEAAGQTVDALFEAAREAGAIIYFDADDHVYTDMDQAGATAELRAGIAIDFLLEQTDMAYAGAGVMVNSAQFNGMAVNTAKGRENPGIAKVTEWLAGQGLGEGAVNYRLRDWLISRQRYWGAPIPMITCPECGIVPVPEDELPVLLPDDVEFMPTGESPLKFHEEFLHTTCPTCGGPAERETDTMDTFMCSSWYQYRYLSPDYHDGPFDPREGSYWLPVDVYTGGIEHATMHLLYTRFFTKAMRDCGVFEGIERMDPAHQPENTFSEPMTKLYNQGIILGEDREKMSKSRGNVIDPDDLVGRYGADTVRAYLMFAFKWDQGGPWDSQGIIGVVRFLNDVWNLVTEPLPEGDGAEASPEAVRALRRKVHQTIIRVTEDIEAFGFNTAIAALMELKNALQDARSTPVAHTPAWGEAIRTQLLLMAPFVPHVSEELWGRLGGAYSIHQQPWPEADAEAAAEEVITLIVQVNGKVRDRIEVPANVDEATARKHALASEAVQKYTDGGEPRKVIYVPGRLVNIVV